MQDQERAQHKPKAKTSPPTAIREGEVLFFEKLGVLWKVEAGPPLGVTVFCSRCRVPLVAFPTDTQRLLVCTKCGFLSRDLKPADVPRIAAAAQQELRTLSRSLSPGRDDEPPL